MNHVNASLKIVNKNNFLILDEFESKNKHPKEASILEIISMKLLPQFTYYL